MALAGFAGTDLFLPMAGRQAGVYPSNWYTTVWIHNPGALPATARVYFLERGTSNPTPPWVDVLVAPSDTEKIDNIVESLFHLEAFGALRVTCATQKLVVTSRVYSRDAAGADADSLGQDFAGVPASFAIALNEKTQILGVHQTIPTADSEFRYNFGFVETTGHTVTVRVSAYDGANAYQGYKDFQVREFSQRQVAFKDHFPTVSTDNSRLEVEVISGTGKVIAYGSAVANGSQDPTTFDMTYADALLAENAAAAITGVTAGNGLSGGGSSGAVTLDVGAGAGISVSADEVALADSGVTTLKLAPNAVTTGKILDGTVAAADVGFNYAGSASKGGPASDLACAGCVALGEIDTSGASTNKVLKYTGATLGWGDDWLTLPYNQSGSSASPSTLFNVTNTGSGIGVSGSSLGGGWGVYGSTAANFGYLGGTYGVYGEGPSGASGYLGGSSEGVHGISPPAGGSGVSGSSTTGYGLYGYNASSGNYGYVGGGGAAVAGISTVSTAVSGQSNSGSGVYGTSTSGDGVLGSSSTSNGVYGASLVGTGVNGLSGTGTGVYGQSSLSGNYGYLGSSAYGVAGITSGSTAVFGSSGTGIGVNGQSSSNDAVYGISASGNGVHGSTSSGYAGRFDGRTMISGGSSGDLLFVQNTGGGRGLHVVTGSDTALWAETTTGFAALDARKPGGLAGYFSGNVSITGSLSKGSGAFKIDHPLDPERKYLYHSFVESPDMKDIYDGVVTTGADGLAVVELPDWFGALNRDFRYQLTVIGRFAQAIVESEIADNRFTIRTNLANVKVSWQVTGIRHDRFADAHRIPVEEDKPAAEHGTYLHPEAWGQPPERGADRVRLSEPAAPDSGH